MPSAVVAKASRRAQDAGNEAAREERGMRQGMVRWAAVAWLALGSLALPVLALPALAQPAPTAARHVTQGLAERTVDNIAVCGRPAPNSRLSALGRITAQDGTALVVPAATSFTTGPRLPDLFNLCTGTTPERFAEVDLARLPVVEIDRDGEVITASLIGDNYFELWVNGRLVGVDAHPYTPFNSSIVRFRVKRPYTLALLLVDWEERLGLGMETMRGDDWFAGDGGVIARFSDGTVTDASWRAQSFYIAPLARPEDVVERGAVHDTSALGRTYPDVRVPECRERCFAVHYPLPANWAARDFDDSAWPRAAEFTDAEVGVTSLTGYTRYPEAFAGARWIWSSSLVFDNLVVARRTVR